MPYMGGSWGRVRGVRTPLFGSRYRLFNIGPKVGPPPGPPLFLLVDLTWTPPPSLSKILDPALHYLQLYICMCLGGFPVYISRVIFCHPGSQAGQPVTWPHGGRGNPNRGFPGGRSLPCRGTTTRSRPRQGLYLFAHLSACNGEARARVGDVPGRSPRRVPGWGGGGATLVSPAPVGSAPCPDIPDLSGPSRKGDALLHTPSL